MLGQKLGNLRLLSNCNGGIAIPCPSKLCAGFAFCNFAIPCQEWVSPGFLRRHPVRHQFSRLTWPIGIKIVGRKNSAFANFGKIQFLSNVRWQVKVKFDNQPECDRCLCVKNFGRWENMNHTRIIRWVTCLWLVLQLLSFLLAHILDTVPYLIFSHHLLQLNCRVSQGYHGRWLCVNSYMQKWKLP